MYLELRDESKICLNQNVLKMTFEICSVWVIDQG